MSSVTIKTHPDLVKMGEKAILTPSSTGKFSISDKAVFHVLAHSVADINYVIGSGSFTLTELGMMQIPKVTMMPLRTSLRLENLDLYREEIEPDNSRVFIIPVFLQQKALEIVDVNINITGNFIYPPQPFNLLVENVTVDFAKIGHFYVARDTLKSLSPNLLIYTEISQRLI